MQCLSSPTRFDVDRAHATRKTLDIGVASVKNLLHLNWKRGLLWWALALSSLPLHLFWNSAVFSTLQANEYFVIPVTEQFLHNGSNTDVYNDCIYGSLKNSTMGNILSSAYDSYQNGGYSQRLNASECIDAYGAAFIWGRRNVLAITAPVAETTRIMPGCVPGGATDSLDNYLNWNASSVLGFSIVGDLSTQPWICCGYDTYCDSSHMYNANFGCNADIAKSLYTKNGTWYIRFGGTFEAWPVDYCLSDDGIREECELQFSSYTLGIVIACNAVKVVSMIATVLLLWKLETPIFATVGDAVASYLEEPDISVVGRCLMSRKEVKAWRKGIPGHQNEALYRHHQRRKLFTAVSKTRWFTTMGLCTLYLAVGILLCYMTVASATGVHTTSQLWQLGLGLIVPNLILQLQPSLRGPSSEESVGLFTCILVANSFQLILSLTYFLYNSLYTAQCGAMEWTSYTIERKSLRVSWPRGQQRSTYWLHLPYRYGIPLTGALTLMHFLISQAVFLVSIQYYSVTGNPSNSISAIGYSPIGILASCCVGAVLILAQVLQSLRPIQGGIPLHGNKSIAISAACHPRVRADDTDLPLPLKDAQSGISLGEVMWGAEVQPEREGDVGHCTFTAEVVEMPQDGYLYE